MNMADNPLRFGVIGLGRMGQNHARVLSLLSGIELTFTYDLDQNRMAEVAHRYATRAVSDLDDALGEVDAVVIASPTTLHQDHVRQALGKVPNIFVEKPLTQDLQTSLELAEEIRAAGALVQVGFIERFNPAVRQLKEVLDGSGRVVNIDFARTNKISARITDVDVITDLMIHDIDLALYLNGPVVTVDAVGARQGAMIDYASAHLTHANGSFSRIQASRMTDRRKRSIEATCSDKFVDCDLLRKEITCTREAEERDNANGPYRITATEEKIEVQPGESLLAELAAFADAIRGRPSAHAPGLPEALAAMKVCGEIRAAI
jgi:predicted dehydrogenase